MCCPLVAQWHNDPRKKRLSRRLISSAIQLRPQAGTRNLVQIRVATPRQQGTPGFSMMAMFNEIPGQ